MGELVDRDLEHLRLLKYGYYIMAGITGLFSLFSLIYIGIGTIFASGVVPANNGSGDLRPMGFIFVGLGVAVLLVGLIGTVLMYLVGKSLAEHRRRVFCIVMAALCCLQMPWGTAIGICTLIVLNRPAVKLLFGDAPPSAPVM